ncbi:MAG TPA: hypothetical protein ENG89_01905, partial [Candidatus Moranbacteria bacterium]|nr:hypothetical protein [Candidatus Moranbacteria bacterium]
TKIRGGVQDIYHIDAYRVTAKNVLDIGWEEIVADKNNIIIIEWANKIKKIIPQKSLWIKLKLVNPSHAIPAESRRTEASENKREIILLSK